MDSDNPILSFILGTFAVILVCVTLYFGVWGIWAGYRSFGRKQDVWDAENQVTINAIRIKQQEQLIQVEKQKAEIRVVEAGGIARSQHIINATLTDRYLQHEAIAAQKEMANSPNHSTIYIPAGQNGIPIVNTIDPTK
ncbi:hypothetical protein L0244_39745 [bacterium]|nr:hypothetical protein [bacterium]